MRVRLVWALLLAACALAGPATFAARSHGDDPSAAKSYLSSLEAIPDGARLRQWHDLLGSEPHVAGTDGDAREIRRLELAFSQMGLDVEVDEFWALLSRPVSAQLDIVGAQAQGPRRGILPIIEKNLAEDPAAAHPDLSWGWNAYSGSGDVTAEVVYANYGTLEDFARLKELGISAQGKIVIARYGGNFRAFKAKFAQEAGAVGLVIYIDPADSGFTKGAVYPQGTWANDTCIQRGTINSLDYPGDPLTPGTFASKDAQRLDESEVPLPKIPVQPIGYGAAAQILAKMTGTEVPDPAWRGGLEMPYRLEGGPELKLRLQVQQKREVRKSANVIARLKGTSNDGTFVVVGCHHDAWGFGAADPLAGTIVLMECARAFAQCAQQGQKPNCDVLFCAWGAEEYGIIGSTEWVENHERELAGARAYVNLDMASMGPVLGASASPSIQECVASACGLELGKVASIGGGSDHVGFIFRCGVPCVSIGGSGAPGTSYHSNYDTTAWYRKTVGEDYASALMVAKATLATLTALSDDKVVPVSAQSIISDVVGACNKIRAASSNVGDALAPVRSTAAKRIADCFEALTPAAKAFDLEVATALARNDLPESQVAQLRRRTMQLDRAWLDEKGVPGRPWHRNLALATDKDSGYRATALPGIVEALDAGSIENAADRICACAQAIGAVLGESSQQLNGTK